MGASWGVGLNVGNDIEGVIQGGEEGLEAAWASEESVDSLSES